MPSFSSAGTFSPFVSPSSVMSPASLSMSSIEALRLARMGGTVEMGEMTKFMSCKKATATPALMA